MFCLNINDFSHGSGICDIYGASSALTTVFYLNPLRQSGSGAGDSEAPECFRHVSLGVNLSHSRESRPLKAGANSDTILPAILLA